MKQAKLPAIFKELLDTSLNPLVDQAQAQGRRAIAYTCSYVPEPLLNVEGLFSVRLRAPGVLGTPMADTYLSSVICSFTRSIMEQALEGMYDSLDGWVFVASCDHMRRLYDNLRYLQEPPFVHILDVPHKNTEAAIEWMAEEVEDLAKGLSEKFEVDTGEAALSKAIKKHNQYLTLLRDIGDLRKKKNPPISGTQFATLILSGAVSPKDMILDKMQKVHKDLEKSKGIDDYRARMLLAGSICDDPAYIRVIEETGGLVVADRTCVGSIPGADPIDEKEQPLMALARHSLSNLACPRMMEGFQARVDGIIKAFKAYKADGVVLETMKFCDTWGVEASPIADALREAGIPVLRLEKEYALTSEGQLQTRIQAFIESMGK